MAWVTCLGDVLAVVVGLDPLDKREEALLAFGRERDQAHGAGGEIFAIEAQRPLGPEHTGAHGAGLGGGFGAQVDHVDQRQARGPLDQVGVGVGGVARHGQHLGAGAAERARHLGQDWARRRGARRVGLGIDVGQDADVVPLALGGRVGLQLGQELQRRGRPHAAEDAQDERAIGHPSSLLRSFEGQGPPKPGSEDLDRSP
jgi:hypothetical protein